MGPANVFVGVAQFYFSCSCQIKLPRAVPVHTSKEKADYPIIKPDFGIWHSQLTNQLISDLHTKQQNMSVAK